MKQTAKHLFQRKMPKTSHLKRKSKEIKEMTQRTDPDIDNTWIQKKIEQDQGGVKEKMKVHSG